MLRREYRRPAAHKLKLICTTRKSRCGLRRRRRKSIGLPPKQQPRPANPDRRAVLREAAIRPQSRMSNSKLRQLRRPAQGRSWGSEAAYLLPRGMRIAFIFPANFRQFRLHTRARECSPSTMQARCFSARTPARIGSRWRYSGPDSLCWCAKGQCPTLPPPHRRPTNPMSRETQLGQKLLPKLTQFLNFLMTKVSCGGVQTEESGLQSEFTPRDSTQRERIPLLKNRFPPKSTYRNVRSTAAPRKAGVA